MPADRPPRPPATAPSRRPGGARGRIEARAEAPAHPDPESAAMIARVLAARPPRAPRGAAPGAPAPSAPPLPAAAAPRILAGLHRGRRLVAPPGLATRPTAARLRQALFDMLRHAPWAGRGALEGARVLDAFAGTGALGLEALSRGAAHASFLETDRAALAALRANVAICGEEARAAVHGADAARPPRPPAPCALAFLDPPYGAGLAAPALAALARAGWLAPGALVCVELGRDEPLAAAGEDGEDGTGGGGADAGLPPGFATLAERAHGAGRVLVLRAPG